MGTRRYTEASWTRRDGGQALTRGGDGIWQLDVGALVALPVFKTGSRPRDLDTRSGSATSLAAQQCDQQRGAECERRAVPHLNS